jgi:hypothetical protein
MPEAGVPTVEDLESAPLRHRFEDMFNPPGLTNFLGAAQVDYDVVAVRSVNFPPVGSGDTASGSLYVDGRLLRSFAPEVTVRWRPDRVVRSVELGGLAIETVTACPPGVTGVVVDIRVTNLGTSDRDVRLAFALASRATVVGRAWRRPKTPSAANRLVLDRCRGALVGVCRKSGAACVQGLDTECTWRAANMPEVSLLLGPGETRRFGYAQALGISREEAESSYDRLAAGVPAAVSAAESLWRRELTEAFQQGLGAFSGSLPVLETESEALRRLYWAGLLGLLMLRRDSPYSKLGRSYDTLMPRYWQTMTFIWDYSLSSVAHALLDPETMRRHLEHWVRTGIHHHYGTEWLTGKPVGVWYSVNDSAITRLAHDYARFSGDADWLDKPLPDRSGREAPVREHVRTWALHWKDLRSRGGLADYGGKRNLLECVSTYKGEVAGLNAMNVWCLRVAAQLQEHAGEFGEARRLREEAADLAAEVLQLYVPGKGYWHARHNDGSMVPVRHCYDLMTAGFALAEDLASGTREEIASFFTKELRTKAWMRALSPWDPDAAYSLRPDHQWNGAYTAWPAEAARALYRLGAADVVAEWLPGLAKSTQEGPFGQGHFVEGLVASSHDGAPKGPPHPPYLTDWACSSGGAFIGLVIEGVFGVDVSLDGEVQATPKLVGIDPSARLRGLVVGGRVYDVDVAGARPAGRAGRRRGSE